MGDLNKPIKKYRSGGVVLSVWENETLDRTYFNMTFQRVYKDTDDNWRTTNNFKPNDLPIIAGLCNQAFLEFGVKLTPNDDSDIPFLGQCYGRANYMQKLRV